MSFTSQDYDDILAQLSSLADEKYKKFNESLIPGTATAYGVRVPALRSIARSIMKNDPEGFLAAASPGSYEEIMVKGFVIAGIPLPMEQRLQLVTGFLPLIDNWAVCDSFCSSFKLRAHEDKALMWEYISPLFSDPREFYARFALVMFLGHFVEEPYVHEGLERIRALTQEQYYVRMAAAWAVSVCCVKFPAETEALLRARVLPQFIQNKAIQKIRESYRVAKEDKDRLAKYAL